MQRYAIVVYDKRNGDVFTTLMTAEDGTDAVAAMNRKDWGTSLRPLSLKRKAGMRASYWDEVTGLESGRYPYGHTTRAARPDGSQGRRIVRIYRADLEAWIKSKEATNAV